MTERQGTSAVRQEHADTSGKAVLVAGAVLVLASLACVGLMALMLRARWAGAMRPLRSEAPGLSAVPLQRSSILETARGQRLQDSARRSLDEWGWVEQGKVARIPISEAAHWLVQEERRGLP